MGRDRADRARAGTARRPRPVARASSPQVIPGNEWQTRPEVPAGIDLWRFTVSNDTMVTSIFRTLVRRMNATRFSRASGEARLRNKIEVGAKQEAIDRTLHFPELIGGGEVDAWRVYEPSDFGLAKP